MTPVNMAARMMFLRVFPRIDLKIKINAAKKNTNTKICGSIVLTLACVSGLTKTIAERNLIER